MKIKSTWSEPMKRFVFYIDEIIVFGITVLAIIFSDALQGFVTNKSSIDSLRSIGHYMSWSKIIVSSLLAILIHGSTNKSYKFDEKDKPPLMKRLYASVISGIGWKAILGMAGLK